MSKQEKSSVWNENWIPDLFHRCNFFDFPSCHWLDSAKAQTLIGQRDSDSAVPSLNLWEAVPQSSAISEFFFIRPVLAGTWPECGVTENESIAFVGYSSHRVLARFKSVPQSYHTPPSRVLPIGSYRSSTISSCSPVTGVLFDVCNT